MPKMKPSVKRLWVKALRSRRYKQCTGGLKDGSGSHSKYCCLGVLCNLYGKKFHKRFDENGLFLEEYSYLPKEVQEWAGLKSRNPSIKSKRKSLAVLNDNDYTFEDIATYIQKDL